MKAGFSIIEHSGAKKCNKFSHMRVATTSMRDFKESCEQAFQKQKIERLKHTNSSLEIKR